MKKSVEDYDTKEVWNTILNYLKPIESFREKNSTGQKSGVFILEEKEGIKLVIDLHFFNDSSMTIYNIIQNKLFESYKGNKQELLKDIFTQMFYNALNDITAKENEYIKFLYYKELDTNLKKNPNQNTQVKI